MLSPGASSACSRRGGGGGDAQLEKTLDRYARRPRRRGHWRVALSADRRDGRFRFDQPPRPLVAIGVVTALATALVENAAKTGWLRVLTGLIAGKQFILYRNPTYVGSSPDCEIYLFKDKLVARAMPPSISSPAVSSWKTSPSAARPPSTANRSPAPASQRRPRRHRRLHVSLPGKTAHNRRHRQRPLPPPAPMSTTIEPSQQPDASATPPAYSPADSPPRAASLPSHRAPRQKTSRPD